MQLCFWMLAFISYGCPSERVYSKKKRVIPFVKYVKVFGFPSGQKNLIKSVIKNTSNKGFPGETHHIFVPVGWTVTGVIGFSWYRLQYDRSV